MTRIELLTSWLGNRQRKYADGVALFEALAKPVQKEKYSTYFATAPANPHIFDPHFTQLINCLTRIAREIRETPERYPAAGETIVNALRKSFRPKHFFSLICWNLLPPQNAPHTK